MNDYEESTVISSAFSSISRGVLIVDPLKDDEMKASVELAEGTKTGVYYYDIEYQFSKPLSLEFTAPYLAFDYYCFKDRNGSYIKMSEYTNSTFGDTGLTLSTADSALSISYQEYVQLVSDTGTQEGQPVVLHCYAKENIKSFLLFSKEPALPDNINRFKNPAPLRQFPCFLNLCQQLSTRFIPMQTITNSRNNSSSS